MPYFILKFQKFPDIPYKQMLMCHAAQEASMPHHEYILTGRNKMGFSHIHSSIISYLNFLQSYIPHLKKIQSLGFCLVFYSTIFAHFAKSAIKCDCIL